jgi:hypothetical protein
VLARSSTHRAGRVPRPLLQAWRAQAGFEGRSLLGPWLYQIEVQTLRTMRSSDGTAIAFERAGDGPPMILVGGALNSGVRDYPPFAELARRLYQTEHPWVVDHDKFAEAFGAHLLPTSKPSRRPLTGTASSVHDHLILSPKKVWRTVTGQAAYTRWSPGQRFSLWMRGRVA